MTSADKLYTERELERMRDAEVFEERFKGIDLSTTDEQTVWEIGRGDERERCLKIVQKWLDEVRGEGRFADHQLAYRIESIRDEIKEP